MGYKLHVCFQNQGIMPGVAMGLRSMAEPSLPGELAFIMASTTIALDEGDTPVKIRNFITKNKKGG